MEHNHHQIQKKKQSMNEGAPWKHLIGFVLCIILTAFSLGGVLYSSYHPKFILVLLTGLAFIQALMQLFRWQPRE